MSVENALKEALSASVPAEMRRQIDQYREFEKRIRASGLEIEKRTFDIPLMGRVTSGLHQI